MAASSAGSSESGRSTVISADGTALHPYASRFPAPLKSKSKEDRHLSIMNRDCGVKIVDYIMKNPGRSAEIWNYCEQLMKSKEAPKEE
jgi:hypothetical protein